MGLLFSRKVAKSSKEILEKLETEIVVKGKGRRKNQLYEKSFISYLLLLSFVIYLVGVATLYLYLLPTTWGEWLVYIIPLLLFPVVVYLIKKLLNWYFSHRKAQFDQELSVLQEEKRKVLNDVMEKETYKTAKELLEKYDPSHPSLRSSAPKPPTDQRSPAAGSNLRHRSTPHTPAPLHPSQLHTPRTRPPPTPRPPATPRAPSTPQPSGNATPPSFSTNTPVVPATPTPMKNMGVAGNGQMETNTQDFIPPGMCLGVPLVLRRLVLYYLEAQQYGQVEYLVGDGPNNRYALICRNCHSHNGMALRDEFEYLTFRCAYCYHVNQASKTKPTLRPSESNDKLLNKMEDDGPKLEGGVAATPERGVVTERTRDNHDNTDSPLVESGPSGTSGNGHPVPTSTE